MDKQKLVLSLKSKHYLKINTMKNETTPPSKIVMGTMAFTLFLSILFIGTNLNIKPGLAFFLIIAFTVISGAIATLATQPKDKEDTPSQK